MTHSNNNIISFAIKKFLSLFIGALFIASSANSQTPNTWMVKSSFPSTTRATAFAFSIGTNGYVGGGLNFSVGLFDDFWKYDALTDSWTQKMNYGGGIRSAPVVT